MLDDDAINQSPVVQKAFSSIHRNSLPRTDYRNSARETAKRFVKNATRQRSKSAAVTLPETTPRRKK
jgi:hypothetical protein